LFGSILLQPFSFSFFIQISVTIEDVQVFLRYCLSKDTIIIGHSLDTDLKALRIVHQKIIDTAAIFPHPSGLPFKISLKKLMKDYLNREIQDGNGKTINYFFAIIT
jgi:RNA exonuclease 1